jgi:hypothetical protein
MGGGTCKEEVYDVGMVDLMSLDYWVLLPLILMVAIGLIMRVRRFLEEGQQAGDESPIQARAGGVEFPTAGGSPALLS